MDPGPKLPFPSPSRATSDPFQAAVFMGCGGMIFLIAAAFCLVWVVVRMTP